MTLFTLRNDKKIALRSLLIYMGVTVFCAVFGLIYEFNSHGKLSNYMLYGFLWPLIGGVGFYTFLRFVIPNFLPSSATSIAYNCGLATLTVGCYFHGVIEIYGTTRDKYVIFYTVLGIVLLSFALIFYIVGIVLKIKEHKTQN